MLQEKDDIYHMNFDPATTPEEAREELASKTNQSFGLGGLATATKGITTPEGRDMANKKFQLDRKKADKDGDGKLSKYEEATGEAIQKAIKDDELIEMYGGGMAKKMKMSHGGMACGCEGECDGSCGMGGGIMGYDDVSGNPIPLGASAENVRDDIDAKISTDEYVIPAHVVKWHGLKHIQMMQAEAEMGLMSMKMDGLIQHVEDSDTEEVEEEEVDTDIDVEVATTKVDDKLDDSDETKEIKPETKTLPGILQKKKYAFMV